METLKNYLDNMFLSIPKSPEVEKAKEELLQMMEDKYYELKSEGKSENEAIGIVITEFGNIEELKEGLGLSDIDSSFSEKNKKEDNRLVTVNEAMDYINSIKKYSINYAIAVMLCIYSPIILICASGLSEIKKFRMNDNSAGFIGIISLLCFIIIAVAIFIYTGSKMDKYEFLKKEVFYIEIGTERFLREQQESVKLILSIKNIIGVALCIISVMPLLFVGFFYENSDILNIFSISLLLFIVGVSMIFFIPSNMLQEGYQVLLQEGDYKKNKKGALTNVVSTVYWCIAVVIYLSWSFATKDWHFTWIVWPIAGVLYGAVEVILNQFERE